MWSPFCRLSVGVAVRFTLPQRRRPVVGDSASGLSPPARAFSLHRRRDPAKSSLGPEKLFRMASTSSCPLSHSQSCWEETRHPALSTVMELNHSSSVAYLIRLKSILNGSSFLGKPCLTSNIWTAHLRGQFVPGQPSRGEFSRFQPQDSRTTRGQVKVVRHKDRGQAVAPVQPLN